MNKSTKQLENDLHELKIKRSQEFQKKKADRNDVQQFHDQINELKSKLTYR